MNQMVVAVFDNESAALEGLRELRDLHREGGVSLYASAVVVKDKKGKVSVKQEADKGPAGTALGLLAGGLVGVLGGPASLPVGAYIGGLTGLLFDLGKFGVDLAFFDDVSKALTAGKAAVLAEVEESWTSLLDERLRKQGGTVYRRFRVDIVEDQLVREGAALEANLSALQHELQQSIAEEKAAIQKDIGQAKKQIKATQDQTKKRLEHAKAEMNARIKALQDQAKEATGQTKAPIEKRIVDVPADFEVRSKKLSQALKLAKEALVA
jgi:uncharacterized membrane protein